MVMVAVPRWRTPLTGMDRLTRTVSPLSGTESGRIATGRAGLSARSTGEGEDARWWMCSPAGGGSAVGGFVVHGDRLATEPGQRGVDRAEQLGPLRVTGSCRVIGPLVGSRTATSAALISAGSKSFCNDRVSKAPGHLVHRAPHGVTAADNDWPMATISERGKPRLSRNTAPGSSPTIWAHVIRVPGPGQPTTSVLVHNQPLAPVAEPSWVSTGGPGVERDRGVVVGQRGVDASVVVGVDLEVHVGLCRSR